MTLDICDIWSSDDPFVERMLKLHKDLPTARTAPDKTAIERQIAATDKQIDRARSKGIT